MPIKRFDAYAISCCNCSRIYDGGQDYIPYYRSMAEAIGELRESDWTFHGHVVHCFKCPRLCCDDPKDLVTQCELCGKHNPPLVAEPVKASCLSRNENR